MTGSVEGVSHVWHTADKIMPELMQRCNVSIGPMIAAAMYFRTCVNDSLPIYLAPAELHDLRIQGTMEIQSGYRSPAATMIP